MGARVIFNTNELASAYTVSVKAKGRQERKGFMAKLGLIVDSCNKRKHIFMSPTCIGVR